MAELARASALDPKYYAGEDWLRFEQKHILATHWQVVCSPADIAAPGDHVVRDIGGAPCLILRNDAGELKGFLNICRHRAGPLATCDGRGAKRLRCAYHGWAYDLDGQLKVAPQMDGAEGFDIATTQLWPIDVAERGGMIWARRKSGPALDDMLAGITDIVTPETLASLTFHMRVTYEVACNWKVYADNFLEGYHLPFVHPGLTQVVSFQDYQTRLGEYWSLQSSPADDPGGLYQSGDAHYFYIYPNTMLNILPGRLQTNRIVPDGPARCKIEFDFYYAPDFVHRAEEDLAFTAQVQEEDRIICEHVQKALVSGAYEPGRLSPAQEAAVWHFQNKLRATFNSA